MLGLQLNVQYSLDELFEILDLSNELLKIGNLEVLNFCLELNKSNCEVSVYDPWVSKEAALEEYGIELIDYPEEKKYDGIIIALAHNEFRDLGIDTIRNFGIDGHILFDLKYLFDSSEVDLRL